MGNQRPVGPTDISPGQHPGYQRCATTALKGQKPYLTITSFPTHIITKNIDTLPQIILVTILNKTSV